MLKYELLRGQQGRPSRFGLKLVTICGKQYLYTTFYSLSLHLTRGSRISQVSTEVLRYTARLMDSNISPLYVDMVIESLRVLTSSDNCVIYFDTLRLDPM